MRRWAIAAGVIAGSVWLGYELRGEHVSNRARDSQRDSPEARTELDSARALAAGRERPRAADDSDSWLVSRVSALEAQLRELGSAHSNSERAEKTTATTRPASFKFAITESELGDRMVAAIRHERDATWTERASSQIEGALASQPHVEVEEVECGSRFCRAAFIRDDGEAPDHDALLHAVPLENEAFTVARQDGRVEVYFTRQGHPSIESMLREPAL